MEVSARGTTSQLTLVKASDLQATSLDELAELADNGDAAILDAAATLVNGKVTVSSTMFNSAI